ncbi:CehA/McbA family metallohydrolase [Cohnella nanjingensis]|uniref:CehA/McbA family metallohydrolase n=1 Tax=Cohnella nanjingensis TaxID=1387779 RepID=A0A7X0RPB6_9BACL|nr:CehA/McbA family metallohydrolase [Cohnella nanjingensis]MBB6671174.1 CehA/McbA family metallohydrolase [Cohnella nanjingensis]
MRWIACELHTHTAHSDGRQSLPELAAGAAALGFECIALTDHNTMSGLAQREEVERETGIRILPGMEWTTFYGHMVTIGARAFVDWREAHPQRITEGAAEVHRHGGVAGLAHPYRIGSPACTGCYWEYEIADWSDLDYIEVWSGTWAPIKTDNLRAYALWTERLNAGTRIAATSGRDWHAQEETDEPLSVTYLGLEDERTPFEDEAVRALRRGRVSVTIGPLLTLEASQGGRTYGIGDVLVRSAEETGEPIEVGVSLQFSAREGRWSLPPQTFSLRLVGDGGILAERAVDAVDGGYRLETPAGGTTWLRAELWGVVRGARALIAFTNAIYYETGEKGARTP